MPFEAQDLHPQVEDFALLHGKQEGGEGSVGGLPVVRLDGVEAVLHVAVQAAVLIVGEAATPHHVRRAVDAQEDVGGATLPVGPATLHALVVRVARGFEVVVGDRPSEIDDELG